MKALACASYDYMKLMVSELQRQLDEIIEFEKAHAMSIFDDQTKNDSTVSKSGPMSNSGPDSRRFGYFPTAPPRRKANSAKMEMKVGPGHRINPFNRCQSEEDFEKLPVVTVHPSSAPGTPRCKRNNGSFKTYCDLPNKTSEKLQGRHIPNRMIKMFQELHHQYGILIEKDIIIWQQKSREPKIGQLISFD